MAFGFHNIVYLWVNLCDEVLVVIVKLCMKMLYRL